MSDDTRPRILEVYTGEDLGPADPSRIRDVPIDDGYLGDKPNPVYRGLPHVWLFIDEHGEIRHVGGKGASEVDADDKDAVHRAIYERTRRRSPDGIGSGGVTLRAATREPIMPKPAADCSGPAFGAALSHADSREDAHDAARSHEGNHSRSPDNRMTTAAKPKADVVDAGSITTIGPESSRPVLTLYDLSDRLLAIEAFIDENADAIIAAKGDLDAIPGLVEQLEQLEGAFSAKVERVALFIENRSAIEQTRRAQAQRFAHLADTDKNVVASLKAYLVRCQRRAGQIKVETAAIISRVQRNSQQSIDRKADAEPLEIIRDSASCGFLSLPEMSDDADEFRAAVVACIEKEVPPPLYSLNREKILEIWHAAYARSKAAPKPGKLSDYDADVFDQAAANGDPVLRALGVTVTQGYHVRLK